MSILIFRYFAIAFKQNKLGLLFLLQFKTAIAFRRKKIGDRVWITKFRGYYAGTGSV
ncbi:MAG: hypothetical protein VKL41_08350 [Snowella sp.]|nr:hypothetical protein [Snowella sp.]